MFNIFVTTHLPERSSYLSQFRILTEPLQSLHSCWPAIRCKSQSYQASARDLGSDNTPFITVRLNLNYFSPHHYVFIRLDGLPGDAGMSKNTIDFNVKYKANFLIQVYFDHLLFGSQAILANCSHDFIYSVFLVYDHSLEVAIH